MQGNVNFVHIQRLEEEFSRIRDVQGVLRAHRRLEHLRSVWSSVAEKLKEDASLFDSEVALEVLHDVERLIATLEQAQGRLSDLRVVAVAPAKAEPKEEGKPKKGGKEG